MREQDEMLENEAYAELVDARVTELTGPKGEYYPWRGDNLQEAIDKMSAGKLRILCDMLRDDHLGIGPALNEYCAEYWQSLACRQADKEIAAEWKIARDDMLRNRSLGRAGL